MKSQTAIRGIMNNMEDSIFTKIINGEIPCHKVYEDDEVIAFLDVHPMAEGHTLVVPKRQIDHVWDLDRKTYAHLFGVTKRLGKHIRTVLQATRVGLVVEGFGVPHAHIHLIPIEHGDDLKRPQDMSAPIDHESLAAVAEKLAVTSIFRV
jgi:histidine triad (HIT) family protein